MPDCGTEALGRGGAFAAKADDPTAIHHNVGGLAQQRGTRLLFNANLARSSLAFQREGAYPGDPNDTSTPWAGKPYPRAENQGGFAATPFAAVTSDFGLRHATFALGTFAPSTAGDRVYPLYVAGAPSPARYDSVGGTKSAILFHTAAAAFRVTGDLDIGVGVHVVQASLQLRTISFMSAGPACQDVARESPSCDARDESTVNGWSGTGSVGALHRPGGGITLGLQFRGPVKLIADGRSVITNPSRTSAAVSDTRVAVDTALPWILRGGVRKAFDRDTDLEIDFTYEAWGSAMNPGPRIILENGPSTQGRQERVVPTGYDDTFSVRGGGSHTARLLGAAVTFRGGAYYDSSATQPRFTRLDNDTLEKFAFTAGLGVQVGSFRLDAAYASVFDVARTVRSGAVKAGAEPGAPAVNEGTFTGHTHIVSIGATVALDTLFGGARPPSFNAGEKLALR